MIPTVTPFSMKVCGSGETTTGASDRDDLLSGRGDGPLSPEPPDAEPKLTGHENLFFPFVFPGESAGDDGVGDIGVVGVDRGKLRS
jgi:hypothetical protein